VKKERRGSDPWSDTVMRNYPAHVLNGSNWREKKGRGGFLHGGSGPGLVRKIFAIYGKGAGGVVRGKKNILGSEGKKKQPASEGLDRVIRGGGREQHNHK